MSCGDDPAGGCGDPESGLVDFGDDRLDATDRRVRSSAFLALLHTGSPVPIEAIARDAGAGLGVASEALAAFARRGAVQADDEGRIVGIAGLSVEPTRHTLDLPQGTRWTWCALDAVGIVGALGSGSITSTGPGGTFEVALRGGRFDPAELVVFVADGYGTTDSFGQWCPLVDFFPDIESADLWARGRGVGGRGVTIGRLAPGAAERWRGIVEGDPR